jgi:hypothetical protein
MTGPVVYRDEKWHPRAGRPATKRHGMLIVRR